MGLVRSALLEAGTVLYVDLQMSNRGLTSSGCELGVGWGVVGGGWVLAKWRRG